MRLPNAQAVDPALVRRIVEYVGRERLASSLHVTIEQVEHWLRDGVAAGPVAGCLRYLAADLSVPTNTVGACVLCGVDASELVADTPLCASCCSPSNEKVRALGMGFWERYTHGEQNQRWMSYAAVSASRSFERPLLATFSAQSRFKLKKDPEVGDDVFDRSVWIETDDYEAVFETFQLRRRRQLVYNLTRLGTVRIDVNDVVWEADPLVIQRPQPKLPAQVLLLGWSLLYETSNAWTF